VATRRYTGSAPSKVTWTSTMVASGERIPAARNAMARLVAVGREVVHAGQAADPLPPVAGLVLADMPVRTGMTPLLRWMPRAFRAPLAIGAPYQHRDQGIGVVIPEGTRAP
jgi:hypothetical protein